MCRYILAVRHGRLIEHWRPLANVSSHALGRRIERGSDRSHAALFTDIAVLAKLDGDVGEIATPGGRWLGVSGTASQDGKLCRIFNCRTWWGE